MIVSHPHEKQSKQGLEIHLVSWENTVLYCSLFSRVLRSKQNSICGAARVLPRVKKKEQGAKWVWEKQKTMIAYSFAAKVAVAEGISCIKSEFKSVRTWLKCLNVPDWNKMWWHAWSCVKRRRPLTVTSPEVLLWIEIRDGSTKGPWLLVNVNQCLWSPLVFLLRPKQLIHLSIRGLSAR